MEEGFSWIKFIILSIVFSIIMWIFAPSLKWKILFTFASILGSALAVSGLSINPHRKRR